MTKIRAAITGISGYVPEYRLTNDELSQMVETSDEWIMQRIGIKERRILKGEGKATSDMATPAVQDLLKKTNTHPEEVDVIIVATITPDMIFPSTANLVGHNIGAKNAWGFDMTAACSGFIYALESANRFIQSGAYQKVIVVGADKMSAITNYEDRSTCPLFGDGAGAVMLEPTSEDIGIIDQLLFMDGSGAKHLFMKAGGSLHPASHETIENGDHYVYQEGQTVFKIAVSNMADISVEMMERNHITPETLAYLVPHQANMRIIEATARRMGITKEKVLINIQRYGNTTAATIPLAMWDFEDKLRKGDNLILTAFGGGFTWGSIYLKWAFDPK